MTAVDQESIDHFLNRHWAHLGDHHKAISDDIWDRLATQESSNMTLREYVAAWEKERGPTEELRIPEDASLSFFRAHGGDLSAGAGASVTVSNTGSGTKKLDSAEIDGDRVATQCTTETETETQTQASGGGGGVRWALIVGVIVLMLAIGLGLYFTFFRRSSSD